MSLYDTHCNPASVIRYLAAAYGIDANRTRAIIGHHTEEIEQGRLNGTKAGVVATAIATAEGLTLDPNFQPET